MIIKTFPLPKTGSLADCFTGDFARVAGFYRYNPGDPASFATRSHYLRANYRTDRSELTTALLAYNRNIGCTPETEGNIARFKDPAVTAVVTGQQAGVLTGPLYTIYKAITAIRLAEKAQREWGIPAVPVFWVAGEDHDYAEINHIRLIDQSGKTAKLSLSAATTGHVSASHIPVSQAVFSLIDQLDYQTEEGDHKAAMLQLLRETATASDSLAQWCARIVARLFGRYGLICFDPMYPPFRRLMQPLIHAALGRTTAINSALSQATDRLVAAGFNPQLELSPVQANLFIYVQGERLPLETTGSGFAVRDREGMVYSAAELQQLATEHPERFSPNVVLRPLTQDIVLPTLAYVGGPGEIAYFGQLQDVYPCFGLEMPVIYPRLNLTVLEGGIDHLLTKYELTFPEVLAGIESKLAAYLSTTDPVGIDPLFGRVEACFTAAYADLARELAVISEHLPPLSRENLGRILFQVHYLQRKAQQHHRRNHRAIVKDYLTASTHLLPGGQWQERVFNIFPYLFRYGAEFIHQLCSNLALADFDHKLVSIGDETHGNR